MLNDNENEYQLDIYKIETKQKLDKKKIILVILIIVAFICVILIQKNISKTIEEYKVYKQYEAQVESINHQAEEKIKAEEAKKEKERQEKLPNLTEAGKENISKIYHSDTKRAFLTFDDGPSAVTSKILDTLKQENIKASFFVLGSNVEARPEMVKRMYDEGHTVALHTASHKYATVYASVDAYFNDLNIVSNRVKRITGQTSKIVRFPGGSSNTVSRHYCKGIMTTLSSELFNRGYRYYDWNVDSGDAYKARTKEAVYKNVTSNLSKNKANVVLMHDIKTWTRDALRDIIRYGKDNGYTFEAIDMNTHMVRQHINN